MPNWNLNRLEVNGKKDDLIMFRRAVATKDVPLDFNKIVPEPDWEWKIETFGNSTIETSNKKIDGLDWYDWRIKNWGTKWNLTNDTDVENQSKKLIYRFETAWAPPGGVVYALIEQFPWLTFDLEYEEPGMGFYGRLAGEDGEVSINWSGEMTKYTHPWWLNGDCEEVECRCLFCR